MKLLFITCLKECLPDVSALLKQAEIAVFSVSKTTGIRNSGEPGLLDDWFASSAGEYDSLFLFSFTDQDKARRAMQLIDSYNKTRQTDFPVRVFILSVESAC